MSEMTLLTVIVAHRITVSYPKGRTQIVSQNRALKISAGIMGQWRKLESFIIHTSHFLLTLLL